MKLVLFIAALFVTALSFGQITVKDSKAGTYSAVADTLLESDTLVYTFGLNGGNNLIVDLNLKVTRVSGTVTSNFVVYKTLDGTNYTASGDTIALTAQTNTSYHWKQISNANWKGFKLQSITGATAQKGAYNLQYCIRNQ